MKNALDDSIFIVRPVNFSSRCVLRGEAPENEIVLHDRTCVIATPRFIVDHVDSAEKSHLIHPTLIRYRELQKD